MTWTNVTCVSRPSARVAIDIPEVLVHPRERTTQGGTATRNGAGVVLKPAKA
ncbi:hypothetical protein [Streptomyces flavidovirens]|uniref:hypothetical protein n=1 Tax=Streptomyces flavidovirens TaxID=67298 RepID=UPI0012FF319D|nr:hypothetical protein [Streptomyces flavidovirens]